MNMGLGDRGDFLHLGNLKPKKVFNLLKKILSKSGAKLKYQPLTYYIDISTLCNLKCPHCFQSDYNSEQHIKREFMKYDDFLIILKKIKDYAFILHLYTWGESLLNPEALKIIRASLDAGIRSRISSNLSVRMSNHYIEELIDSGLYRLTCSIDGPTQEIYEKYRVKGNLERVLDNAKRILETRKRRGSRYPILMYRMIVFEWNHNYVEQARELAKEIGFDGFSVYPGIFTIDGHEMIWDMEKKIWTKDFSLSGDINNLRFENSLTEDAEETDINTGVSNGVNIDLPKLKNGDDIAKAKSPCHWLFNNMVITANGRSLACCTTTNRNAEGLSLFDYSLSEVWNTEGYENSRKYSLGLNQERDTVMSQCKSCSLL